MERVAVDDSGNPVKVDIRAQTSGVAYSLSFKDRLLEQVKTEDQLNHLMAEIEASEASGQTKRRLRELARWQRLRILAGSK